MTQKEFVKINFRELNTELQERLKQQDEQARKNTPGMNISTQASKELASILQKLSNETAKRLNKDKVINSNAPKKFNKSKPTTGFER